jgi:hypothetical protein
MSTRASDARRSRAIGNTTRLTTTALRRIALVRRVRLDAYDRVQGGCSVGTLLNQYADQIPQPDLPSQPRDRIVVAATALHDALAAWPWAAEVVTADGFVGLLDESAVWMVEAIVAGAIDHGCTPAQAVYLFRSIWYYTVGEILVRAHSAGRHGADDGLPTHRDGFFAGLDASRMPRLTAIGDQWPTLAARDTYPQALRAFVDGLLAQTTSATP